MSMFGIEFTSNFTEFLFFAILLAIVVGIVWLCLRLKQSVYQLASVRRDNSKLRNEVANITGWTVEGRLPDDWQDKLSNHQPSTPSQNLSNSEIANNPVLHVAHLAFMSIEPPSFATNNDSETIDRDHKRITGLLQRLSLGQIEPESALANGDFDKLICYWRRLEAFFHDENETFVYAIAANAVLALLKREGIEVLAPRPLTITNTKNCVLSTDDDENLRNISRIRAAISSSSAQFQTLQPNEEIIIDCQRLGWNGPNGQVKPRTLILDKSW